MRLWVGTVRYRCRALDARVEPTEPGLEGRHLYVFWHETMLIPALHYGHTNTRVLVSPHADGEIIAQACRRLGLDVVRGSSLRGGRAALKELVRAGDSTHIVITPDGPVGPRRRVQPGVVIAAARTGLPVVPLGVGFRHAWRLGSWDRFAIPLPWSVARGVLGRIVRVPRELDDEGFETYRAAIERSLEEATIEAEKDAATV